MNRNILYDEKSRSFNYFNSPLDVSENDSCYLFTDKQSGELIHYIDYDQLLNLTILNTNSSTKNIKNKEFCRDIIRMALKSKGKQNVPTSILLPEDTDTTVHDKIFSNYTSLKQLYAWFKFLLNNIHGTYELGSRSFTPFEPLQIENVFQSINVSNFTEESRKVFEDSVELFDFEHNLAKIGWFETTRSKYKINLPNIDSENDILERFHPNDVFVLANEIMKYVFVFEAANYPIDQIVASNIIFIHFLQDTGSSTNAYRPLLPVMQAALSYSVMPAIVPSSTSTYVKSKVKLLVEKAKFNKGNNRRGWYKLYMKLKNINSICNKSDCLDILQYTLFEYNVFEDEAEEIIQAFLRTVLKENKKAEMYIYILQFGFCLASLRLTKLKTSDSKNSNLANFEFKNMEVKNITAQRRQALYVELKNDIAAVFDFLNPYINYLRGLEKTNSSTFNISSLNESSLVYFMKTNNSFSELVNHVLKTILPLITCHLA